MMRGIDPKQLRQAMKKMGMEQEEIEADEVIIKMPGKNLVIKNPSVAKVTMMGEESFQISGKIVEQAVSSEPEISEDDIQTVTDQTGCSKDDAIKFIKKNNGNLAQAILELQKESE